VARRGPGLRDGRERVVYVTTARERHGLGRSGGRAGVRRCRRARAHPVLIRWVSVSSSSVHPHNTSVLTAASFICAGGSLSATGVIDTRWRTPQAVSGTS
jgi:hypothetical protein